MTGLGWAEAAWDAVLRGVGETARQVGDRFPLYADPVDGRWTTTGRGSWTGGFWAGLLRLRALRTGEPADRAAAAACTARLAPWAEADTATRGLILWYGTALGGAEAGLLRERAAASALAAYDPGLGLVPWGAALGGPRARARADGVPGLVPLLASSGPDGEAAAAGHLHRHLDLCLDGAPAERPSPAWEFMDGSGWRACPDPEPGWTRGEAWLLLAVADALLRARPARDTLWRPERLREAAELLLDKGEFWYGPLVPPARAHHPDGPLDTSAAAIGAVALLKLAHLPGPEAAAHRTRAESVLRHLTRRHLARPGGTHPAGLLRDGCYDAASGTAVRHALVWGDFFLALGLGALLDRVDLRRV
ncbi:sugar ABC transporter permease [Streptomyces sp. NPDC002185]|uniref:sugar ABC transporter permease n=1 Tax=Streptomyces sp. NPDC002185 TaxID=3364636 RepID=UPI0036A81F98